MAPDHRRGVEPALPPTETEPAKGPFYDEIDEEKAVVIREVFERIAAGETAAEVGEWLVSIKCAKHARVIVERRLAGKTYREIAKELDLTEYHMENCAAILRLMEVAGLTEPYRRLTEKPDRVSQWCSKHWLRSGDRKGGGKRRRAS